MDLHVLLSAKRQVTGITYKGAKVLVHEAVVPFELFELVETSVALRAHMRFDFCRAGGSLG